MFPTDTAQDLADIRHRHLREKSAQAYLAHPFFSVQASHFNYNFRRKFRKVVAVAASHSPLFRSVLHVVLTCTQKQMRGIYTRTVITTMADHQFAGLSTVMDQVRNAGCWGATPEWATHPKPTIAITSGGSIGPLPAVTRRALVIACVKSLNVLFGKNVWGKIRTGHISLLSRLNRSRLGGVLIAPC